MKKATMADIAENANILTDSFLKMFREDLPREMAKMFQSVSESVKTEIERSLKPIYDQLSNELLIFITSAVMLRSTKPTEFMWMLYKKTLEASEKVKRKYAENLPDYDIENDIARTRKQMEAQIATMFKTEIVLWKLMDQRNYGEAKKIVEVLWIERENAAPEYKIEVANWKMELAFQLMDIELFFEGWSNARVELNPGEKTMIDGAVAEITVRQLLARKLQSGMGVVPNQLGRQKIQGGDFLLPATIGQQFEHLLTKRLVEEIFTKETITTAAQFHEFMDGGGWDDIVRGFKLINPYVENIVKPAKLAQQ